MVYKEYYKPFIHNIDSIIDNCVRDSNNKYFHTFDHLCVCDIKFINIVIDEKVNLTIAEKSMSLYNLKKLKVARQSDFYIYSSKQICKKNLY